MESVGLISTSQWGCHGGLAGLRGLLSGSVKPGPAATAPVFDSRST